MQMPKRTQSPYDPSRQYDADGSVRPTKDTGFRVGMDWRAFEKKGSNA